MEQIGAICVGAQCRTDHGEFDAFYLSNKNAAYKVAIAILGCDDSANDAVQEAFVRLLGVWHRARYFDSPIGFLLRTTARCCIDALRARRPRAGLLAGQEPIAQLSDTDLDVQRTMDRIKPMHRALLALSVGQGWSYEEIAEALGIPPGTVASRLNAARKAFKKQWGDKP